VRNGDSFQSGRLVRSLLPALLTIAILAAPRSAFASDDPADPVRPATENSSVDDPAPGEAPTPGGAAESAIGTKPAESPAAETTAETTTLEKPYWRRNLFGRFFSDQKYLFTDWAKSEVRRPGFIIPVAVGTSIAFAGSRDADASQPDVTLERDLHSDTHGQSLGAAHFFTTLGDAPVGMLLIGTAYLTGRWTGHDRFAGAASLSAEAVLDTGLWVTVLKGLSARTRPSSTGQFFQYHPTGGQQAGSFPSGHTSGAFAAASVFAGMYREDHRWVPWAAYGTATLVGISRIALGRHFPTDVLVGAFIGDSFGRMVLARERGERPGSSQILPYYDPATHTEGAAWRRQW
jgi:PAP2 superfamily